MPIQLAPSPRPPLGPPFRPDPASPQAAGLEFWVPIQQSAVDRVADVARGNLGTNAGSGTAMSCMFWPGLGFGLRANNAERYISWGDPVNLQLVGPMSISCWLVFNTFAAGARIFVRQVVSNASPFITFGLEGTANGVRFDAAPGGVFSNVASSALSLLTPYHVVGVYDRLVMRIYVNGILHDTSGSLTAALSTSGSLVVMGCDPYSAGEKFDGGIWDQRIYSRALSPQEIWQMWAPQTRWALYRSPGRPQFSDTIQSKYTVDLAGTVTPAGLLAKSVSKAMDGTVTPDGLLVKQAVKAFSGSVTPTGTLTLLRTVFKTLSGAISSIVGVLVNVASILPVATRPGKGTSVQTGGSTGSASIQTDNRRDDTTIQTGETL